MTKTPCSDLDHFVKPTEDKVCNLDAGCFVRVQAGETCFWAEICERAGDDFVAIIHNELSTPQCHSDPQYKKAEFSKEHIVALGCDHYCWC